MKKEKWTFDNIPDQNGRIVLITGANSGIGYQESLMLAGKGAEIIMACRDLKKAEQAAASIKTEFPAAKLFTAKLDLADLEAVSEFAETIKQHYEHLDVLINNAGVMIPPFLHTKQGFELQFGTNHLGHFALTGKLLPLLTKTPGSRIVSVSSLAAMMGYPDLKDLNFEHKAYRKWPAYGQSKLANLMFIRELALKLNQNGSKTIATAAHPGGSPTNLQRTSGFFMKKVLTPMISHPASQGALPILRAACDPEAANASYWGPSGLFGLTGAPAPAKIPDKALDADLCHRLWEISEKLTNISFAL